MILQVKKNENFVIINDFLPETSFGYVFNVVFPLSTQWVQSTGSLQEILILVELFDHLVGLALKELNYRKRFLIILAFYSQVTDIVFFSTLFILLTSSTPPNLSFFSGNPSFPHHAGRNR